MDCEPSGQEIGVALGRIVGLRPDEILVIDEFERVLEQPRSTKLICQRTALEGEDAPL